MQFLNAHWLLDKLHMTGSVAQMVNGLFLVCVLPPRLVAGRKLRLTTSLFSASYVVVRLIMGTYNSVRLWKLLVPAAKDTGFLALRVRDAGRIRWLYLILNLAANSLNFVSRDLLPPAHMELTPACPPAVLVPLDAAGAEETVSWFPVSFGPFQQFRKLTKHAWHSRSFVPTSKAGARQAERAREKPIPVDGKIAHQDKRVKGQ